jgi:hypothetical protein
LHVEQLVVVIAITQDGLATQNVMSVMAQDTFVQKVFWEKITATKPILDRREL